MGRGDSDGWIPAAAGMTKSAVVRGTKFVNDRDHCRDTFGFRANLNTVPKIEYMTAAVTVTLQNLPHFPADTFRRRVERTGIEIAL